MITGDSLDLWICQQICRSWDRCVAFVGLNKFRKGVHRMVQSVWTLCMDSLYRDRRNIEDG